MAGPSNSLPSQPLPTLLGAMGWVTSQGHSVQQQPMDKLAIVRNLGCRMPLMFLSSIIPPLQECFQTKNPPNSQHHNPKIHQKELFRFPTSVKYTTTGHLPSWVTNMSPPKSPSELKIFRFPCGGICFLVPL